MRAMAFGLVGHIFRPKMRGFAAELFESISNNRYLVLLSCLMLSGMAAGALYSRNVGSESLLHLDFIFNSNIVSRASNTYISNFTASFASSFLFILACFLSGLSLWGVFIVPAVLFFRGFGLGLTSGYMVSVYGGMGVLFYLCVILPGAFVSCLAIIFASREGMHYSRFFAFHASEARQSFRMKWYLMRFGGILGLCFLAALIDLTLSSLLGGLFSF